MFKIQLRRGHPTVQFPGAGKTAEAPVEEGAATKGGPCLETRTAKIGLSLTLVKHLSNFCFL